MNTIEVSVQPKLAPRALPEKPEATLDEYLKGDPAYQNIGREEMARLLGFFTEKEQVRGFPWHPYKPKEPDSRRVRLSDMEAFRRLEEGKSIELQPMQIISVDLSPEQLAGIASLGSPISGAASVAASAAKANFGTRSLNREISNGKPILISSPARLKLLYHLHNVEPDEKEQPNPDSLVWRAAKDLSFFTAKSKYSPYPWSFHAPERNAWKVMKSVVKGAFKQAAWMGFAGGVAGALLGGPVGALFGIHFASVLEMFLLGTQIGVFVGGIRGALRPLRSQNGEKYDEISTLGRLLQNEPVRFQKGMVQSFGLPLVGNFRWVNEYGKASVISNLGELTLFSKMENQEKPETKKPPA